MEARSRDLCLGVMREVNRRLFILMGSMRSIQELLETQDDETNVILSAYQDRLSRLERSAESLYSDITYVLRLATPDASSKALPREVSW